MDPADVIYIGAGRHVVAIDATDGRELWRTKLPKSGDLVTLVVRDVDLLAGSGGRMYCLSRMTGQLLWQNDLPHLGYGSVIIAAPGFATPQAQVAAEHQAAQARAASAASGAAYR